MASKKRKLTSSRANTKRRSRQPRAMARAAHPLETLSNWYFWEQDPHHRYTRVWGAILEKTGTDPKLFIGKSLKELGTVPVDHDGRWDHHWAVLDSHQPFSDLLFTFPAPDGSRRYISASGEPVFGARKKFLGYRGVSRDVTPRVLVERRRDFEHEASRILTEAAGVTEAAQAILQCVGRTFGWACGQCWEVDHESQSLRLHQSWGDGSAGVEEFIAASRRTSPLPLSGDGLLRRVSATGQARWLADLGTEPGFLRAAAAAAAGFHGAFAIPIQAGSKILGVMEFFCLEVRRAAEPQLLESCVSVGRGFGQFCQRQQTEDEMHQFRTAIDSSPDLVYLIDPLAMRYLYVNETACRLQGVTREQYLKITPMENARAPREELQKVYDEVIAKGDEGVTTETLFQSTKGNRGWFEVHRRALRMGDRWVIVAISREITQRKRAQQAALRQGRMFAALSATNEAIMRAKTVEELYQRVCDAAVDGGKFLTTALLLTDPDTRRARIVSVAGKGEALLRIALASNLEATPQQYSLIGAAFRTRASSVSNEFLKDERLRPWHSMAQQIGVTAGAAVPLLRGKDAVGVLLFYSDERRAFDEEIVKLLERLAENVVFALENFEHETERKRAEERIQYLATHDGLTGLPNRVMFSELLNLAIPWAKRHEQKFAVLFIDLDRFKVINDTLGHEAGDKLLQEMAARLRQCLRASDVVARLGGDEFVVLIQEVNEVEQVTAVARKILSAAIRPAMIQGQECRVTASIGISVYPTDAVDEQSLMKNADQAMYLAKEEGKNNFQFYSKEIKTQSLEHMALEVNLRHAIERNELSLHYQAKLDLKSGQISGVEALLRWNSAELGAISPMQLIPIAEETGLIVPIGRWVLRTACEQNVAWQRQGLPPVCMAVNLSPRQFADPDLLKDIADVLTETGMAPELLELEITESMVMHNIERAVKLLNAIKELGVRLAIDDFGTGYSSLAQLKRFPIDTLKVDRSFIREIPNDSEDRAITEAIIAMGKSLSLNVVAEGVETSEQQAFLRQQACDEMQGYYFSKPVAPEQFAELLRTHVPGLKKSA